MKYARLFAALTLLCILGAWQAASAWASLAFIWCALPCAILATAYQTQRPHLLGKRPNGTLKPLQVLALAPYHFLNTFSYAVACVSSRENAADEIVPGLWLSRRLNRFDGALIERINPHAILDAAAELPELGAIRTLHYLSLPVLDTSAPSEDELQQAALWIKTRLDEGPVLVHCALGHGRSATLVAAYLMASERVATAHEAIQMIHAKRPRIEPSREQMAALQVLEAQDASF